MLKLKILLYIYKQKTTDHFLCTKRDASKLTDSEMPICLLFKC